MRAQIALFGLLFIASACGLKCNSGVGVDEDNWEPSTCTKNAANKEQDACIIKYEADKTETSRGCGMKTMEDKCNSDEGMGVCVCDEDMCNAARGMGGGSFGFVVLTSAITVAAARYFS